MGVWMGVCGCVDGCEIKSKRIEREKRRKECTKERMSDLFKIERSESNREKKRTK